MNRSLGSLFVAGSLFGLALGLYELALPLFLDDRHLKLETIGLVLAAGAAVNFLAVVYGGRLSDLLGRKGLFAGAFLASAGAVAGTPWVPHPAAVTGLKTVHAAATSLRQMLRTVAVYETVAADRFGRVFPRLTGTEIIAQTFGVACVSLVGVGPGATLSYTVLFGIGGAALALGFLVIAVGYREGDREPPDRRGRLSLAAVFAPDLHPKLWLIVASSFIFTCGLGMSHALWALYFRRGLAGPWAGELAAVAAWLREAWPGAAELLTGGERGPEFAVIAALAVLHRACLGVPMVLLAPLVRGRLKTLYIGCLALSGVMTAAVALADWLTGSLLLVVLVFPLHDVVGASIWFPIQEQFILRYSRPDRRAAQVAKVRALGALGMVVGTAAAGPLMAAEPALPFAVGGGLTVVAAAVLAGL